MRDLSRVLASARVGRMRYISACVVDSKDPIDSSVLLSSQWHHDSFLFQSLVINMA